MVNLHLLQKLTITSVTFSIYSDNDFPEIIQNYTKTKKTVSRTTTKKQISTECKNSDTILTTLVEEENYIEEQEESIKINRPSITEPQTARPPSKIEKGVKWLVKFVGLIGLKELFNKVFS
jgi:hypothetical protein